MKISRIRVENFRSIEQADIVCDGFNIFIGQNNSGKTNLFEAVEWFFYGTPKGTTVRELTYKQDADRPMSVTLEFTHAISGASKMLNETNRKRIQDILGVNDVVSVRREGISDRKRTLVVDGKEVVKPPTGFDAALNDFLPRFEYVSTKQYFNAVAAYSKKTPIGIMLSGVLSAILEKSKMYQDFLTRFNELFQGDESEIKVEFDKLGNRVRVHLEKQFPDCTRVSFAVSPPEFDDLLKSFETSVNDGIETTAGEKGDGMQRALMLAIIQAYSDFRRETDDAGKSFLFFIDEAELHLHPTAQRKLKNVLLTLADGTDQVFMNTHSSVFVADDHPQQSVQMVEKHEGATEFSPVSETQKPYVVYDLLGGSPSDLLLPRNFLIVEGKSEVELLTRIMARHYADRPTIQCVPAEGDTHQARRTINSVRQAFAPLGKSLYHDRVVILCDHPQPEAQEGYNAFLRDNPALNANEQIFTLPHPSVEECYPDRNDWRRTADRVARMTGAQKLKLARRVGDEITQEEFEIGMDTCFQSLTKAWELAL